MISVAPAPRKSTLFHVVASICFVMATVAATIALFIASFGTSYCGDESPPGNQRTLRIAMAVIGDLWSAVPALVAVLAVRRGRAHKPWLILASCALALTLYAALTAEPSHLCLF